MEILRSLDKKIWRQFVDEHPQGNIFHSPEMFEVFKRSKGYDPQFWAITDKHGVLLALLLPVHVTLVGGPFYSMTTRAIAYGSLLAAPGEKGRIALQQLLRTYKSEMWGEILFTELRNLHDMSDLEPLLSDCRFVYEGHLNYLIDLDRPEEELLQSIGRRTRKKIRKGLRDQTVKMSEVTQAADLGHWYEVLKRTYSNSQVPLADPSLFEAAFDVLYPAGMAKFLLAKIDGVTVSCSVELPYKKSIYGWYGGTDREYSKYSPNEMLMWHILAWGANHGYQVYDFGGAGKPEEEYGVRDFKAKFSGELVNYGRHVCVHAPLRLVLSEAAYQVFRRFL